MKTKWLRKAIPLTLSAGMVLGMPAMMPQLVPEWVPAALLLSARLTARAAPELQSQHLPVLWPQPAAAERALASIGDNRSVEAGRDWRGLLIDLATPVAPLTSRATNLAAGTSEKDDVADACVLVLQLLAE